MDKDVPVESEGLDQPTLELLRVLDFNLFLGDRFFHLDEALFQQALDVFKACINLVDGGDLSSTVDGGQTSHIRPLTRAIGVLASTFEPCFTHLVVVTV